MLGYVFKESDVINYEKIGMKKQLIIIGTIVLLVCVELTGCNEVNDNLPPEKSKFVGKWVNTTLNFTTILNFFSDGTFSYIEYSGTWDLKDGQLVMEFRELGLNWTKNFVFSNNDRTLSLTFPTGGKTQVFTKQ